MPGALLRTVSVALLLVVGAPAPAHDSRHSGRAGDVTVAIRDGYRVPDARVVDARGRTLRLPGPIDAGVPVLVNFVYTTCSTICSTQTATLAEVQRQLAGRGDKARFVSFTIDPDNDTPQRLAEFARRFGIERDWDFLSGDFDELLRVQRAFDVYRGSKANHPPVVLMRRSPRAPWVRVEGFATPDELLAVYQKLPAPR